MSFAKISAPAAAPVGCRPRRRVLLSPRLAGVSWRRLAGVVDAERIYSPVPRPDGASPACWLMARPRPVRPIHCKAAVPPRRGAGSTSRCEA
jgi:hypothetical protein